MTNKLWHNFWIIFYEKLFLVHSREGLLLLYKMYSETTNYQKNQRKDRNLKLARDLSSGAEFEIAEIFKYFMSSFLPLVKIFFSYNFRHEARQIYTYIGDVCVSGWNERNLTSKQKWLN